MRIAVAGASGLVGSRLVPYLRERDHEVIRLVRRPVTAADEVRWDPAGARIDVDALADVDVVINLAGVGIGDHRWTPEHLDAVEKSRTDATGTLARAVATLAGRDPSRPRALVNASAIGWYGDTGDIEVDERAPAAHDTLGRICRAWEAATAPADVPGARVAIARLGIVQSAAGGALGKLLPIFRLGVGGRLSSGNQWTSWVTREDTVRALEFLATHDVSGPFNVTAPTPVTNAEYSVALGRALHRPALLPVPRAALRAVVGRFADEGVLASQRVLPRALLAAGFTFEHSDVYAGMVAAVADK